MRVDWLVSAVVDIFVRDVAQPDLEFTHFSRERRHQGVLDEPGIDVAAAHLPAESWHLLPQSRTRMRQKEVDVAVDAECRQDRQLLGGEAGGPEEGDTLRQVDRRGPSPQCRADVIETFRRAGCVDALTQHPPEMRLPPHVFVELIAHSVGVRTGDPVEDHLGPVGGVAAEQLRQVLCCPEPASDAETGCW